MKNTLLILSSTLLMSSLLLAENNANQLLDEFRKDLHSMSANFEQYDIDVNQQHSEILKGKMWLNSPDQFKWEYFDPAPQLIVANGQKVWIYDEDLDQVTIKQQGSKQNPIYVLLNKEETDSNYTVEIWDVDNKPDGIDWISLTPKVDGDEIKQVWIGIFDNNLKILKLKNQLDNIVVFEFSHIVKNPELADEFFTFVPPKGIDIITGSVEF